MSLELREEDISVETFRKGGKTNSADNCVRVTHLPTGTVVIEGAARSLMKNKANALRRLKKSLLDEEIRPWGRYDVLYEDSSCKIKRIVVQPSAVLSLQYHRQRDEFWYVVSGLGILELGNETKLLKPGDTVSIGRGVEHRVRNGGMPKGIPEAQDLVFVEVQTGDYFGEDDIIRLEDAYGRSNDA